MVDATDPVPGHTAPAPVEQALRGVCPRCGGASLFAGLARFAPRCPVCGLDFAQFNVGDGPAAFLTLIVGTVVTVLAIALELAVEPPWWVHVLLWPPVALAGIVATLRIAKAALLRVEFVREAREGRLHREDQP